MYTAIFHDYKNIEQSPSDIIGSCNQLSESSDLFPFQFVSPGLTSTHFVVSTSEICLSSKLRTSGTPLSKRVSSEQLMAPLPAEL